MLCLVHRPLLPAGRVLIDVEPTMSAGARGTARGRTQPVLESCRRGTSINLPVSCPRASQRPTRFPIRLAFEMLPGPARAADSADGQTPSAPLVGTRRAASPLVLMVPWRFGALEPCRRVSSFVEGRWVRPRSSGPFRGLVGPRSPLNRRVPRYLHHSPSFVTTDHRGGHPNEERSPVPPALLASRLLPRCISITRGAFVRAGAVRHRNLAARSRDEEGSVILTAPTGAGARGRVPWDYIDSARGPSETASPAPAGTQGRGYQT